VPLVGTKAGHVQTKVKLPKPPLRVQANAFYDLLTRD